VNIILQSFSRPYTNSRAYAAVLCPSVVYLSVV